MADFNISNATTTNMANSVPDFIVDSMALDVANKGEETFVYYDKAAENYGYYFNHPQISSQSNSVCTWAFMQGWGSQDKTMIKILISL